MAFEKYTIEEFVKSFYEKDYSLISEQVAKLIYDEYIAKAKLFETEEFNRVATIEYLNNRINAVKLAIKIQRAYVDNFDIPYPDFSMFKKYGYNVYYNTKEDFLAYLEKIENKEKKMTSQLENKLNELVEFRLANKKKERNDIQPKEAFIRVYNTLGKLGYNIDKRTTTMEEMSIMVLQQSEERKR